MPTPTVECVAWSEREWSDWGAGAFGGAWGEGEEGPTSDGPVGPAGLTQKNT